MTKRTGCRWPLLLIVGLGLFGSISLVSLSQTYESTTLGSESRTYYKDCDGDGYVPMNPLARDEYERYTEDCELQDRYRLTEICEPGPSDLKRVSQEVRFFGGCHTYYIWVEVPTEYCHTHSEPLGIEWVCESTCDAKQRPACYTRTEEPLGEDLCDENPELQAPADFYRDIDGDGVGDSTQGLTSCSAPEGYVTEGGDLCDENPDLQAPADFYRDVDGDGLGSTSQLITSCAAPRAT